MNYSMTTTALHSIAIAILRVAIDSPIMVYWNTAGQSPGS